MLPELSDQDRNWYILKGYEVAENYGSRTWRKDYYLHREDGPAVERYDGTRIWYLNGYMVSRKQHRKAVQKMKIQNGTA